jgi:hypothetical protein
MSQDYGIDQVYGGDCDCQRSDSLMQFRTLITSSVDIEVVKDSGLIIDLNPFHPIVEGRCSNQILIEMISFVATEPERKSHEYSVKDQPIAVTEKAYALSAYHQTLLKVHPGRNDPKIEITADETMMLTRFQDFLKSQRTEIVVRIENEITMVDNFIAKHCPNPRVH